MDRDGRRHAADAADERPCARCRGILLHRERNRAGPGRRQRPPRLHDLRWGGDGFRGHSIWSGTPDAFTPLALQGDRAPGTPQGTTFGIFSEPIANGAGQTAFLATVAGPGVNPDNDLGLWAGVPRDLRLIAREGDLLDLGGGDSTMLRTLDGALDGGGDRVFSDTGELAFLADFTDGSAAVLVATVPEPATAAPLAAVGTIAALCRRRGRRRRG